MPMLPVIPSATPSVAAASEKTPEKGAKGAFETVLNRKTGTPAAPTTDAPRTVEITAATKASAQPGIDSLPVDEPRPAADDEKVPQQDDQLALADPMAVAHPLASLQTNPKATQAEPDTATQAEPNTATQAEPNTAMQAEPNTATQAEPNTATQAEPNMAAQAEPNTATQAEPNVAAQAEPNTATQAEPNVAAQAEPNTATQAEPNMATQAEPNMAAQAVTNSVAQPVTDTSSQADGEKASPSLPEAPSAIVDTSLRTGMHETAVRQPANATQAPLSKAAAIAPGEPSVTSDMQANSIGQRAEAAIAIDIPTNIASGAEPTVPAVATETDSAGSGTEVTSAPLPSQGKHAAVASAGNAPGMEQPDTMTASVAQNDPTAALRNTTRGTLPAPFATSREDLGEARFSRLLNYMDTAPSVSAAPAVTTATTVAQASATATQPAVQVSNVMGWRYEPTENNHGLPPDLKRTDSTTSGTVAAADSAAASELLADADAGVQQPVTSVPAPKILQPEAEKAVDWRQEPEQLAALSAPAGNSEATAPATVRSAPAPHAATVSIPEHEVMDQVIQRSSLRELEGKQHLTVELHPQDLGQVKLDLVQENNRLQLHLQAQNGEVCDILQKHLPRLQEALAQQGLRLDTIQVSVDSQSGNAQGFFEQRQQQPRNPRWNSARETSQPAEIQTVAAKAAARPSASGLSLRI